MAKTKSQSKLSAAVINTLHRITYETEGPSNYAVAYWLAILLERDGAADKVEWCPKVDDNPNANVEFLLDGYHFVLTVMPGIKD